MMEAYLANPERMAWEVVASVAPPDPPVDYMAWAGGNVVYPPSSPFRGPFDPRKWPLLGRIFGALAPDHPCKYVTLLGSAQTGKTNIALIFLGGTIDQRPCPMLYVQASDGNAVKFSRTKWGPFARSVPSLSGAFPSGGAKEGGNSTLYKERTDGRGWLLIAGANSEVSLSQISCAVVVEDDLSKWTDNAAGDPEPQADSRAKGYLEAKILKIGTPLLKDNCRTTRAYQGSTMERPWTPCPHCNELFVLDWENMRRSLEGDDADPTQVHATCPACDRAIEEYHRDWMMERAVWRAEHPERESYSVGFWTWTAHWPFTPWVDIAREWLAARGNPAREQVFLNDWAGEVFDAPSDAPPWEELQKRADANERRRGIVPVPALRLVFGIDCQGDRVEWALWGFGRGRHRWLIDAGVVPGHIRETETRKGLSEVIAREWLVEGAAGRVVADLAVIDAGYSLPDVQGWAKVHPGMRGVHPATGKPRPGVIMIRGAPGDAAPVLKLVKQVREDGRLIKTSRRFFNIGASPLKMGLYYDLKRPDPLQDGYVDLPYGIEGAELQQLTAERRREVKRRDGSKKYDWVKPEGQANEQLDMAVYAAGGAYRLRWEVMSDQQWAELEAERAALLDTSPIVDLEEMLLRAASKPPRGLPTAASANTAGEASAPANGVRTPDAGTLVQPQKPGRRW